MDHRVSLNEMMETIDDKYMILVLFELDVIWL